MSGRRVGPIRALWRAVAALYPRSFREDCGQEMEETFVARYRDARAGGRARALRFAVRELAAAGQGALAERLRPGSPLGSDRAPIFVGQDLRHAVRRLLATPLFSGMTLIVLAGGLGISIFTASFLHTAVNKPLPVEGGSRIVRLNAVTPYGGVRPIDAAELARMRPEISTLNEVGAFANRTLTVGSGEGAWTLDATAAEANLFTITRARPLLGRTLTALDQARGAEPVVVLSHRAWRLGFGLDSAVIGRLVQVNQVATRVVGVMPEGFEFPVSSGAWVPIDPELLDPLATDGGAVDAFGRLVPGVDARQVESELEVLLARVRADRPVPEGVERPTRISARTFPEAQVGDEGMWVVAILNGLAALILLLACINVGNLLLARANEQRRELAVRQALGASRGRLVMQHLWETILLSGAGGLLATLVATGGLELINDWSHAHLEGNLAFWWQWGFDRSVLLASGGFVTLAVVVLGGAVSLRATRERFLDTLRAGSAPTETRESTRWSSALVVVQIVVVSVVMFVGVSSGILGKRLLEMDPGHDTERLIRTGFDLRIERYATLAEVDRFRHAVADALTERKEVERIHFQTYLAALQMEESRIELPGLSGQAEDQARAYVLAVDGPLATLGVPMQAGRFFEDSDTRDGAPVTVVSQALAFQLWPGGDALGRQIRLRALEGEGAPWRTVIGVAGDLPYGQPLSRDRSPVAAYLPLDQTAVRGVALLVKHRGTEAAARAAIVETVAGLDPGLDLLRPQSYREMFEKGGAMVTATAKMFGGCFVFALLLAVTGTYGLVARGITRRTREIGIRRALGASDARILQLLVWQGGRHLGLGAALALPFTAVAALGMSQALPLPRAVTLLTAVAVSISIAATVFVATWLPTRRAVRIEPRDALWKDG
ncbi:MAG: ABC transporter permease [Gemmatimonadales bacterium]